MTRGGASQWCFNAVKKQLVSPPLLAYPNPELPSELISDASITGCGAVLTQGAYFPSKISSAERNHTTGEQEELLGLIKAKDWRCYLGCTLSALILSATNPCPKLPMGTMPS